MVYERFKIDNGQIIDIYSMIEPIQFNSTYHGLLIRDLLNKNWLQFNEQKCMIKKLRNQNKKLYKINKELCHRLGELYD